MEAEHCSMGGFGHRFVKGDKEETWPANEWAITVRGDTTHVRPSGSRKLIAITELMERDVVKQAELTRHEVIAVVLYTGPMVSRIYILIFANFNNNRCPIRHCSLFGTTRRFVNIHKRTTSG